MIKTILVSLAVVTVSTSAALAATHHGRAMKPQASATAASPKASVAATSSKRYSRSMNAYAAMPAAAPARPGVSSKDEETYMKNLHDSGYDPKNDRTPAGNMRQQ